MHHQYLLHALNLAQKRKGFCAPNPSVGAVIVKDNKTIAEGFHFAAGHPHAEVEVFNKVDTDLKDAILYVTLEPCCHFGKTPPCTDLIIARGIKKVYYGYSDPNPIVAGKGAQQLQKAGILCEKIEVSEIDDFYKSYAYWHQTKKPFITAKLALSLNGKIAGINGERIKISGDVANEFTHECRRSSDAILTTAKTINKDNPQLNVRIKNDVIAKPIYILDRNLEINLDSKIFHTAKNIIIFHDENIVLEKVTKILKPNVKLIPVDIINSQLDLNKIVEIIGHDGVHDLYIEAGGTLFQNLLQNTLINRAYFYVAPKWLPKNYISAFNMSENLFAQAKNISWKSLGEDGLCVMEL